METEIIAGIAFSRCITKIYVRSLSYDIKYLFLFDLHKSDLSVYIVMLHNN